MSDIHWCPQMQTIDSTPIAFENGKLTCWYASSVSPSNAIGVEPDPKDWIGIVAGAPSPAGVKLITRPVSNDGAFGPAIVNVAAPAATPVTEPLTWAAPVANVRLGAVVANVVGAVLIPIVSGTDSVSLDRFTVKLAVPPTPTVMAGGFTVYV